MTLEAGRFAMARAGCRRSIARAALRLWEKSFIGNNLLLRWRGRRHNVSVIPMAYELMDIVMQSKNEPAPALLRGGRL